MLYTNTRRSRRALLLAGLTLLIVSLACGPLAGLLGGDSDSGGSDGDAVAPPPADSGGSDGDAVAPPPSGSGAAVTVVNGAQGDICTVFISSVTESTWGDSFIVNPIAVGDSQTFDVAPGDYDIRADDCSGNIMHSETGVSVQGTVAFNVSTGGGPTVPVVLQNNSAATVCYVLISPTGAADWGADRLDASEVIGSGDSHTFNVAAGDTDFQARDCDQNVLSEEIGVSISGSYNWIVE